MGFDIPMTPPVTDPVAPTPRTHARPHHGGGAVIPGPEVWGASALCAQTDPELFFPPRGESPRPAKSVCARCPVQWPCLEWALTDPDLHGVVGGTTFKERQRIRVQRHAA